MAFQNQRYSSSGKYSQLHFFNVLCYSHISFFPRNSTNSIMTMWKKVFEIFANFLKNKTKKSLLHNYSQLCLVLLYWSTFGTNSSRQSFWTWCYQLSSSIFRQLGPFFSAVLLQLHQVGWKRLPVIFWSFQRCSAGFKSDQSLSNQTRESCFFWSESPSGTFW